MRYQDGGNNKGLNTNSAGTVVSRRLLKVHKGIFYGGVEIEVMGW
jgi:hypothetical protein